MQIGIGIGIPLSRGALGSPAGAHQTTSVKADSTFAMGIEEGNSYIPGHAFTMCLRFKDLDWGASPYNQTLLSIRTGEWSAGGDVRVMLRGDGTIVLTDPASVETVLLSGSPSGWCAIWLSGDGASGAVNVGVSTSTTPGASVNTGGVGKLYQFRVFANYWETSGINEVAACTLAVFAGQLTTGEKQAQFASDTAITPSVATVHAFYPMTSAATAHVASTGSNLLTYGSAGTTVTDSPYG